MCDISEVFFICPNDLLYSPNLLCILSLLAGGVGQKVERAVAWASTA